ncbi:MAG TPA: alpha/beta hydrolase [Nevskiaceae bacterium]|nr:alpha/beta hydrolase [Nevskiaceae bacterium]
MKRLVAALLLYCAGVAANPPTAADFVPRRIPLSHPLSWDEVLRLPPPPPVPRMAYGPAPQQFGELRVPVGAGPFPVALLVHGGCWQAGYAYRYFSHLAAWLAARGIASWTVEYRRLGDAGGGWPNTFLDVAAAADALRALAQQQPLDLTHVVAAGHSAGGQLALWLAARAQLPASGELHAAQPLPIAGVVALAPITDLAAYRIGPPDSCNASVEKLLGGTPQQQPQRYAQASPVELLPLRVPQWIVQGSDDRIVPAAGVRAYAQRARAAGDRVELAELPRLGHFDVAVPGTGAEAALTRAFDQAAGR